MPTDLSQLTKMFLATIDPRLQLGFAQIIHCLIFTKSCVMSEWARSAYDFDAFIKKCYRFFRNPRIDWKINQTILNFLLPRFKKKKHIPILIDPSFVENRTLGVLTKTRADQEKAKKGFYLLSAALPVRGRAISFFQSFWRNTQIDYLVVDSYNKLIKVQLIKLSNLLKPVLAKAVFIMDRGFGYEFFLKAFIELEINYVVRVRDLNTHVVLKRGKKRIKIKKLIEHVGREPVIFNVLYKEIVPIRLVVIKKYREPWVLATSLDNENEALHLYCQRMKIEEAFKDWKSTGFNIEKMQFLQWDVVPKIIWCVVVAHMLLYLIGETIDSSKKHRKLFKKFIRNRKDISCVQLAWKAWKFALNDILPLLHTLKLHLMVISEAV